MAHTFDERFVPHNQNKQHVIFDEHYVRYALARQYVAGKRVVDVASGAGYGSYLLAQAKASVVVGIDSSETAVHEARQQYSHTGLSFAVGDATHLPLADASTDVVVSFETVEHIADDHAFMAEIARVLAPEGVALISTPNADMSNGKNPFHVREYTKGQFTALVRKHFQYCTVGAQHNGIASYVQLSDAKPSVVTLSHTAPVEPLYWVALCGNQPLPAVASDESVASINEAALQHVYHNPALVLSDAIYTAATKIPYIAALLGSMRKAIFKK